MDSFDVLVWTYTAAALVVAARLGWVAHDATDVAQVCVLLGMTAYVQWNYWRED